MGSFQIFYKKPFAQLFGFLLLATLGVTTGLAQPKQPIGQATCDALKQQYEEAVKAGNGALVNQLGQQLNKLGCYDQPKTPPPPPVMHYTVGGVQTVPFSGAGPSEGQSTVIRPGANPACSAGVLVAGPIPCSEMMVSSPFAPS